MIYLLDTNVLSALRRPDRAPGVAQRLANKAPELLYISTISLGEIERGLGLQRKRNPMFAADLADWLGRTREAFEDRILPFGEEDAIIWGRLAAELGNNRMDLMIAATALAHDATMVSGDKAFAATGVRLENPFE